MNFTLNEKVVEFAGDGDMPLLWAVREHFGMTGTKYGCGIGACGACTVHVDGMPIRSCSYPVSLVEGKTVTTIEGLSPQRSHPVQQAWIGEDVPQCGYCQSGMIMAVAALLEKTPRPTDAEIDENLTNLCRCATYKRIRDAVHVAANNKK